MDFNRFQWKRINFFIVHSHIWPKIINLFINSIRKRLAFIDFNDFQQNITNFHLKKKRKSSFSSTDFNQNWSTFIDFTRIASVLIDFSSIWIQKKINFRLFDQFTIDINDPPVVRMKIQEKNEPLKTDSMTGAGLDARNIFLAYLANLAWSLDGKTRWRRNRTRSRMS